MARLLWPRRNRFAVYPVSAGLGFVRQLSARVNLVLAMMHDYVVAAVTVVETPVNDTRSYDLLAMATIAASADVYYLKGTCTMTVASPCVVTYTSHGFSNGQVVRFSTTGALPTGLTAGRDYFVVNAATNTFQVSTVLAGAAITTTGTQSGTHSLFYKV